MDRTAKAILLLGAALVVGASAQSIARQEAMLLGLTSAELFLLAAGATALVKRVVIN